MEIAAIITVTVAMIAFGAMLLTATWFASRNFYNAQATVKIVEVQKEVHQQAVKEFSEAVDDTKPMDEVYSMLEAEATRSPYDKFN